MFDASITATGSCVVPWPARRHHDDERRGQENGRMLRAPAAGRAKPVAPTDAVRRTGARFG